MNFIPRRMKHVIVQLCEDGAHAFDCAVHETAQLFVMLEPHAAVDFVAHLNGPFDY